MRIPRRVLPDTEAIERTWSSSHRYMLLLMLVAIGVLTPKELLEAAKIIQSD